MQRSGRNASVCPWLWSGVLALAFVACVASRAGAEEAAAPVFTKEMADAIANSKVAMDIVWTLVTGFLVFFMNLRFALVESGLCRAKNTTNILAKNYIVFAVS